MSKRRFFINLTLLIGLGFSIYILIVTLLKGEWNTVAGSLAVITAIVSSWITQRIIWKQEQDFEPLISIYFDLKSRQDLIQLVVENNGGSDAYDIKILWEKPLYDHKNNEVHFNKNSQDIEIPIINKGQKYSLFVNSTLEVYKDSYKAKNSLDYSGLIYYKRTRRTNKYCKTAFSISLEPYRKSLSFENEELNFFAENAKIHDDLKEINKSLKELIAFEKNSKPRS